MKFGASEIRKKYKPEEIIKKVEKAPWPSRKYYQDEYHNHKASWEKTTKLVLSEKQFTELQEALLKNFLQKQSNMIYFYRRGEREILAFYSQAVKYLGKKFKSVGLIYDVKANYRIGFWKITKEETYFQMQPESVLLWRSKE